MELGACLDRVRERRPLIHCITNYVTANDVANLLLACGASPIMADEPEEVEEITARCAGLCLNLGTPSRRTIPSLMRAGVKAGELGRPVVLDPVGVGASALRLRTAQELMARVTFTVLRGNVSELRALAGGQEHTPGGGRRRGGRSDGSGTGAGGGLRQRDRPPHRDRSGGHRGH